MGHYGLGYWRVLSLASDFRAVWLVWLNVEKRASGKAFGAYSGRRAPSFKVLIFELLAQPIEHVGLMRN